MSSDYIKSPRRFFGVQQWEMFIESLYERIVLDAVIYAPACSQQEIETTKLALESSTKCRRRFEQFVWLTLHYFFKAVQIPQKQIARGQLQFLKVWVKGDSLYGRKFPDGAPTGSKKRAVLNQDDDSSDDEPYKVNLKNKGTFGNVGSTGKGRPTEMHNILGVTHSLSFDNFQNRQSHGGLFDRDVDYQE